MKSAIMKKLQPKSQFDALVYEALPLYRELNDGGARFGDDRDQKLSAEAYLKEALTNAPKGGMTLAEVQKLDKLVASLPEKENEQLLAFVGNATRQAAATRMDQGVNLRPPTLNLHVILNRPSQDFVMLLVQASMAGTNPLQLVALAALRATRGRPDAFGRIDDYDERERTAARLNSLLAQIRESWQQGTLEYGPMGDDSRVLVSVRVGDAVVPVAPLDSLGERLCAALA